MAKVKQEDASISLPTDDIGTTVKDNSEVTAKILKYVEEVNSNKENPQELAELVQILPQASFDRDGDVCKLVDELYLNVLEKAARRTHDATHADPGLCARLRVLIGTVVLLQKPMSIPALAQLTGIREVEVTQDVNALSAVLLLGPDTDDAGAPVVHIFHPSFRDFLLNRCYDPRFSVQVTQQHHTLSVYCLQILNRSLKYDLCDIKNPTIPHYEVANSTLPIRLQQHAHEAFRYATQFWISHIALSGSPNADLLLLLRIFVSEHIFHWIEALGLIEKLSYAMQYLFDTITWSHRLAASVDEPDLHLILHDTLHILQRYRRVVESHALQIYYSGNLSMPQCALFKAIQEPKNYHAPQLLSKRAHQWANDTLIFDGYTSSVLSVAFSPDGTQIISGSDDNTVRFWDARTGQEIARLHGHTGCVLSVAFSPHGTKIASGSDDNTVRIWGAHSGHELSTSQGHSRCVQSVAFSPDGAHIVSGSSDETVRLWDVRTGHEIQKYEGHTDSVWSVAFSPDGTQIVSGADDKTVRVWDVNSRREITRLEGHAGGVMSVAFSPDGSQIASGSNDHTIRVWDASSGHQTVIQLGHVGAVWSVSFSPDGTQIASGSDDNTIRLWDAHREFEFATLGGHSSSVKSVAFSPDGTQIASSSYDRTVRLWDTDIEHMVMTFQGHYRNVSSIAFSPDGTQIVSGSDDNTVRLWDARTGNEIATLEGHTGGVLSAAFSPDGTHIVSGSDDNTVRLWDAHSGRGIATMEDLPKSKIQSVAFSRDNCHIRAKFFDGSLQSWAITDIVNDGSVLKLTPREQNSVPDGAEVDVVSSRSLHFDRNSGWIMISKLEPIANQENIMLCWLPIDLRGFHFATYNENLIAIASDSTFHLSIIDVTPMLDMLRQLEVI